MIFQIFRHHNKVLVEQFLENLNESLDLTKSLNHTKDLSLTQLRAMQSFAQMRELADSNEMGFVASFIEPDGSNYTITNLPHAQNDFIIQKLLSEPFVDGESRGRVQFLTQNRGNKATPNVSGITPILSNVLQHLERRRV
jgi:hypothetical protein